MFSRLNVSNHSVFLVFKRHERAYIIHTYTQAAGRAEDSQ